VEWIKGHSHLQMIITLHVDMDMRTEGYIKVWALHGLYRKVRFGRYWTIRLPSLQVDNIQVDGWERVISCRIGEKRTEANEWSTDTFKPAIGITIPIYSYSVQENHSCFSYFSW